MTTETTVSKGQEFCSPGQTEGRVKGKINWECCNTTAAADTIETIGQCVPFQQECYCSQQIATLAGK